MQLPPPPEIPPSVSPPPPAVLEPDESRYDILSEVAFDKWMNLEKLVNDSVLCISENELYNAHSALRKAHELIKSSVHQVYVILPLSVRKHKGFTPWLQFSKTQFRGNQKFQDIPKCCENIPLNHLQKPCILLLQNSVSVPLKHVAAAKQSLHHASFDFRISGAMERTLVDTGATCCCISESFVKSMQLPMQHCLKREDIGGVGGEVQVLGTVTASVKLRKMQVDQLFYVVRDAIAGYHCLLGQDFLTKQSCALLFTPNTVAFAVNGSETEAGRIISHRKILNYTDPLSSVQTFSSVQPLSNQANTTSVSDNGSISALNSALSSDLSSEKTCTDMNAPLQGNEKKSILHAVHQGTCMAYRVIITPPKMVTAMENNSVIPSCIQEVINTHSDGEGTLRGSIPPNTHVIGHECHIELVPGARPVQIRQYRLTPREREELEQKVKSFIEKGWIEPSTSSWCSSVLFVPKPGGKLRFCVDYRRVNAVTEVDKGPIPSQEEMIDRLQGACYFTALDLASGFYQLAISKGSRGITAFPTPLGLFQWRVMPMGLCNAPATFQRAMNDILKDHIQKGYCLVYIDDIIIFSPSIELHSVQLDSVLTTLKSHNLFCQLPKCVWAQKEIKYLGHVVSGLGVLPDSDKVKVLDSWHIPPSAFSTESEDISVQERKAIRKEIVHQCRRFLGFMNYFSRFIPKYADMASILHEQTSDDAPAWTEKCTESWNNLKTALSSATLMYHPVFSEPFHVYPDASSRAIGGVLMQLHDGNMQPVAYCARKLIPAETRYITTEQEMLGMVYCFQKWRCYLDGTNVIVHTDHEPLTWLQTQATPSHRQARWLEYLSRFQFKITYVRGDKNVVADALSRMLNAPEEPVESLPGDDWPEIPVDPSNQLSNLVQLTHRRSSDASPDISPPTRDAEPTARNSAVRRREKTSKGFKNLGGSTRTYFKHSAPSSTRKRTLVVNTGRRVKSCKRVRFTLPTESSHDIADREGPGNVLSTFRRGLDAPVPGAKPVQSAFGGAYRCIPPSSRPAGRDSGTAATAFRFRYNTILSITRFAAAGGHTRARSVGGPTWGKEGARRVTNTRGVQNPSLTKSNPPLLNSDSDSDSDNLQINSDEVSDIPAGQMSHSDRQKQSVKGNDHTLSNTVSSEFNSSYAPGEELDPSNTQDIEFIGEKPMAGNDQSLSTFETLLIQLFSRVQELLCTDAIAQDVKIRESLGLTFSHNLLWKGDLLYIPDDIQLKRDLLYWHHDVPWCGHLGIQKTLELVKRQFWWPKLQHDISEYIKTCHKCQLNKVDRRLNRPPLTPNLAPDGCWRTVGMDFIVDLPMTTDGHNAVLNCRDHLSKMYRCIATTTTVGAKGTAKLYFKEVFPHYGMPLKLISDRDTRWNNEFWTELCRLSGVKLSLSTAYHPQTNGLVERGNEVVSAALRHYVSADQKDWDDWLPFIEFAVNNAFNESTQCSAFSMNRITLPRNPFDGVISHLLKGQPMQSQTTTFMGNSEIQTSERTFVQAHAMFQWARQCLEISKQKMKERYMSKGTSSPLYEIGEMVWLSVKNLSLKHPSRRHKLLPRYVGPLKIIGLVSTTAVTLDLPTALKIHPTVSVSQIKPYYPRTGVQLPPVTIDDNLEWELEDISDHRVVRSKKKNTHTTVQFKIVWKGGAEDTWHEFPDLNHCLETLEQYLMNRCSKAKRSAILKILTPDQQKMLSPSVINYVGYLDVFSN